MGTKSPERRVLIQQQCEYETLAKQHTEPEWQARYTKLARVYRRAVEIYDEGYPYDMVLDIAQHEIDLEG